MQLFSIYKGYIYLRLLAQTNQFSAMALNPELLNNEDFEKVDHDPYQDENVTSTSLTGEMAEEDRYEGNTGDLLGDEYTSTAGQPAYREEPEQLISFDSTPHPEPSAPIPETTVTEPTPPPVPSSRVEPFPEPTAAPTGGINMSVMTLVVLFFLHISTHKFFNFSLCLLDRQTCWVQLQSDMSFK